MFKKPGDQGSASCVGRAKAARDDADCERGAFTIPGLPPNGPSNLARGACQIEDGSISRG
ncbi:MAG: hypothetical protein FD180_4179 [Planctomycetota bacterium]|nr:MAG: hypothetical protein FD180_4179 [Planctomycetota bacterium]